MAAKTLKINFLKFFDILIDIKLIFINSESISAMTGPTSFSMQPKQSGRRCYLITISFRTSIIQVFKISKKKFRFFLVILIPFEIFLHYPKIDSSHWLRKDGQWISKKVSGATIMV